MFIKCYILIVSYETYTLNFVHVTCPYHVLMPRVRVTCSYHVLVNLVLEQIHETVLQLQLPENNESYGVLLDKGIHPAFTDLHKTCPVKSPKLQRCLQRYLGLIVTNRLVKKIGHRDINFL